jgi:AraC-like DNA-binding protein
MPQVGLTGLLRLSLFIVNGVEEYGLDPRALLHAAGLDDDKLQDPDSRVPISAIWNLWRMIVERVDDPDVGVRLGSRASARQFGLVGYTLSHSATLGEAIKRLQRYAHILSEAIQIAVREEETRTEVIVTGDSKLDALRQPIDARLATILSFARELTGTEIVPLEVRFPYPRPIRYAEQQRFFLGTLLFDQPDAALVLRQSDMARPVSTSDETLAGYLDRLAEEVLGALSKQGSFEDEVRRAIWEGLSDGSPSLRRSASRLGVSVRTLQRRLREEGTSFAAVLDAFRHDLALHLLRDRRLAIYEVAYLLGYSDPSTFYRAFRRWWGTSPHDFRKMLDIGDETTGMPRID